MCLIKIITIQQNLTNRLGIINRCIQFRPFKIGVNADHKKPMIPRLLLPKRGYRNRGNGLNLNTIEASDRPAEASWENINAMDDVVREILLTTDKVTIAAMRGNAGAGGVFLALAADRVVARDGIVLNPHYKNMGNLYGSEYWTYLLPQRSDNGAEIMQRRLPIGVLEAREAGLIDAVFDVDGFEERLCEYTTGLAAEASTLIDAKQSRRERDESQKPLDSYRDEELEHMRLNFFGFDPSYHVARYYFVNKTCHSRTPPYLAAHRRS